MAGVSRELQLTLQAAYREAVHRRHEFVTVEHLLFALLHDERGMEIIHACAGNVEALKRDLERFFDDDMETLPGDDVIETRQTLAFHRVLQHAVDHSDSAEKEEVEVGDLLVALYQEPDSYAVGLLRSQDIDRLDILQYISHGITKSSDGNRMSPMDAGGAMPGMGEGEEGVPADPLEAFATDLTEQAAAGELDPMIGRGTELERTIHILARRRKNNPIFVGETGVGKTALAEGMALRIHEGRVPADLENAEIFSLDLGALLAGTRYRGDLHTLSWFSSYTQKNMNIQK